MRKLIFMAFTLLAGLAVNAQNPIYRMVPNPNGVAGAVVIFLEWPANAAHTDVTAYAGRTTMFYDAAAGVPTVTSVQGTWAIDQSRTAAFINNIIGAANNPDNYDYIDFATNSTIGFGNVAPGTTDTVLRLQFPNTTGVYVAELVEGINGAGGDNFDNTLTGAGLQATLQWRKTSNGVILTQALDQNSPDVPLPVELVYLTGDWDDEDAIVEWATATEINNKHFDVERSFDGVEYEYIGTVESQATGGNSDQVLKYTYTDYNVKSQTLKNVYYRLVQTDYDGTSEVLGPVVLTTDKVAVDGITIFPVPAKDFVTVQTKALTLGKTYTMSIIDNFGKTVQQIEFVATENQNNTLIDITGLRSAVYWVKVEGDNVDLETQKFVKIH